MTTEAAPLLATRSIPGPRTVPNPDIRPRAGHELFVGVEQVLTRLSTPGEVTGVVDTLRTALARTAALGDSCRVRPQCDGVRLAADLLLTGEIIDAHAILVRTKAELADRQRQA
jgi:hypothetical protein